MDEYTPSMMVRPRSHDGTNPFYAPERDIAFQFHNMLIGVNIYLVSAGVEEMRQLLLDELTEKTQLTDEAVKAAYMSAGVAVNKFVAAADGRVYTGPKVDEWPEVDKLLTLEQALDEIDQGLDSLARAALKVIKLLVFKQIAVRFFYGLRSYQQMGRVAKENFDQLVEKTMASFALHNSNNCDISLLMTRFRSLAAVLFSAGVSENTLNQVVSEAVIHATGN